MPSHRFTDAWEILNRSRRPEPVPSAASFAVCPGMMPAPSAVPASWAAEVYRLAYEQTRANLSPPRHVSALLASAN